MSKIYISAPNLTLVEIPINKFPGGEVRVKVPSNLKNEEYVHIKAFITDSDGIMGLVMVTDALRNAGANKIRLTLPYVPYGRQDRVCSEGESFSLKMFANIINSLNFSSIILWDSHSDVTRKLIHNTIELNQVDLMSSHVKMVEYMKEAKYIPTYLVAPDKGSMRKVERILLQYKELAGLIIGDKVRDMTTGKIIKYEMFDVPEKSKLENSRVLIVDDLCDGGRTFIEIAKVIENHGKPKEMTLFVTHGIFSAGMDVFNPYFDNVWSYYQFNDYK